MDRIQVPYESHPMTIAELKFSGNIFDVASRLRIVMVITVGTHFWSPTASTRPRLTASARKLQVDEQRNLISTASTRAMWAKKRMLIRHFFLHMQSISL